MKMRVIVSLLAASAVAGLVSDSLARRTGGVPCCLAPPAFAASATTAPVKTAPRATPKPDRKAQRKVVATYFHGNFRCVSCRTIEAWTAETIRKDFARDIQSGRLEWRTVNTDQRGNEHYLKDYKLFTQSVVLSDTRNGRETRWKNMVRVWPLLGDEAAFKGYVHSEVSAFLKGA